jgi:hypothetical protein
MPSASAIGSIGEAIVALLAREIARPEVADASIALARTSDLQTSMENGIAVVLYRVAPAVALRSGFSNRDRPNPAAFDLHYLLVAYARNAASQQRLLGLAIDVMESTPVLDVPGAQVRLTADDVSIADLTSIWIAARAPMQPCAAYLARSVAT